ncbi:hypothetical protein DFP72DRAFT_854021 [Ephemerocybe angulata]|uniref:Uncharacterized protein n=1 Tax=Ephemerocybe angulata TaxID=980116 RepID=A0A8H6HIW3_9AGAR|nr:hypothetical protein DFP72DRAFT_854021 [Tulosesus angulatus]
MQTPAHLKLPLKTKGMSIFRTKEGPFPLEMVDQVLQYLPLQPLSVLANLRDMEAVVKEHLERRITNTISSFSLHAKKTLNMMEETGTVLSGSAALEITSPGSCVPEDLNFYSPSGAAEATVEQILLTSGFALIQEPETAILTERTPFSKLNVNNGVKRVFRLSHRTTGKRVTVIESLSPSPLVPIFFFHLTTLMNCVTGRGAISFYPDLTETYTAMMNPRRNFAVVHKPMELVKWQGRGTAIVRDCDEFHPSRPNSATHGKRGMCQRAFRHSQDGWSLSTDSKLGPTIAWRLGHKSKDQSQAGLHDPVVHLLHEEWHLRTHRLLEIWVEYLAPMDEITHRLSPKTWRQSFP